MCPIFQVSNVSGENLALLRMFLNLLSTRMPCDYAAPAEFQIDETFAVPVGITNFHSSSVPGLAVAES
jgi:GTPase